MITVKRWQSVVDESCNFDGVRIEIRLPNPDQIACGPNQDAGPGNGQHATEAERDHHKQG